MFNLLIKYCFPLQCSITQLFTCSSCNFLHGNNCTWKGEIDFIVVHCIRQKMHTSIKLFYVVFDTINNPIKCLRFVTMEQRIFFLLITKSVTNYFNKILINFPPLKFYAILDFLQDAVLGQVRMGNKRKHFLLFVVYQNGCQEYRLLCAADLLVFYIVIVTCTSLFEFNR